MESILEDLINHIGQNMPDLEVVDEDYGQLEMLDQELTDKINELVDKFNSHTHILATGAVQVEGTAVKQANLAPITVPAVSNKAAKLNKKDYEDETIKH